MEFVSIDVETANADVGSICQVGLARFIDGHLAEEWTSLVDPEDYFDGMNIAIHGIEPEMVRGQPTFAKIEAQLRSMLESAIAVCHTHFDRVSVSRACERYGLPVFQTTWLDTARVARRTWKECAWSGYGLAKVCERIGYEFKHHDALEDAKAAAQILLAAMRTTELDLEGWQRRVNQPIDASHSTVSALIRMQGNPEGDLYGEVLVFTGALEIPRREAADLAARVGLEVASGVTKKTTILVVGDQDARKLHGGEKSNKHAIAEKLAASGQRIRIIRESDFKLLVRTAIN
jgi:DNA polymerase III subunit epsilon